MQDKNKEKVITQQKMEKNSKHDAGKSSRFCILCKTAPVSEVSLNNKKYYFCSKCEKISERFVANKEVAEEITGFGIKHFTVGAIITREDKILLVKRRVWPFMYDIPAGHLEFGENPTDAVAREVLEEVGIKIQKTELVHNETRQNDSCRYGSDIHEWLLYRCEAEDTRVFTNSELDHAIWVTLKEAEKVNVPPSTRHFIKEIIPSVMNGDNNKMINEKSLKNISSQNQPRFVLEEKKSELLYHISQALFGTHEIDNVLAIAAREVLSSFNITSISIQLVRGERFDHNIFSTKKNGVTDVLKSPDGKKLLHNIASSKKMATNYDNLTLQEEKCRKNSLVGIPLITNNRLIGIIAAHDESPRFFTEEEVQTLSILSTLIALAIENSRLHLKQEEKIKNLSELFSIAAGTSNKVKNTIEKMTDTVPDLFSAEKALLLLLDNDPRTLKAFAHSGISDQNTILSEKITLDKDSISKSVFETGRAYISNHTAKSKKILPLFRSKLKIRSILSVPVMTQNHCIGVLHLINKNDDGFNEEDARLAMVVASRIGIKIENAILQERTNSEKELLNNVIENTNEGIIVVDSEGKVRIWNKYLQRLTGLSCQRVINKLDHSHSKRKDFCGEIAVLIQDALKNRSVSYLEKEMPISDGVTAWFGITASYISDREGNLENIVFVLRNISKEKELLLAKNDLISTATHELRTPLTAIKGYLSMLLSNDAGNITPLQHRFLDRAFSSSERLVKLVEDLLSALRIDENRVSITPKNFDINELIEESIESLKSKAASKKIKFDFDTDKRVYVYADREKSKHVVDNILDNAIKYTKERGKVSISVKDSGHNVLLKIEDTGVGIPQDALATVFDRFTRINNPLSIQAGGTGLGLYIAKSLIERQGGKIWVESTIKKGSIFYITMPSPTSISND